MFHSRIGIIVTTIMFCLFGCGTTATSTASDQKDLPKISISYDHNNHTCITTVSYRGKTVTQTYSDDAYKPEDSRANVIVRVGEDALTRQDIANYSRNPVLQGKSEAELEDRFVYHVFGFCRQEATDVNSLSAEIWIEMWLPSPTLEHDGNSIGNGFAPADLAQEGFSITFPRLPNLNSSSSKPTIFENGQMRLAPSYFKATVLDETEAGNAWYCIYGEEMRMIGGTFTVAPGTKTHSTAGLLSGPLSEYSVILDRWEFEGYLSLSEC